MTLQDIPQLRLKNQGISDRRFKKPEDVVRHLGAVQAQDYNASLWAVGLRMIDAHPADIEKAIADRKIIRLWPMRGTIHFVTAEDARWMHGLLTPKLNNAYISRSSRLGLTPGLAKAKELFIKAMKGDKQITRTELYQILEKAGLPTKNSLGLHIIGRMAHDGLLVCGPRQGKQPTFALFDEWVPKAKTLSREEALEKLAVTYFTGHGPAQIKDLNWWSGLSVKDIRKGIELAGKKLEKIEVEGKTYYTVPIRGSGVAIKNTAYLLPPFDEYVVGYRDREAVLENVHKQKVNPGANGILSAVVVINGQVVGNWKKEIKKGEVVVRATPFTKFSSIENKAVQKASERYARFVI